MLVVYCVLNEFHFPEDHVVENSREAVQFEQGVLQRRGREQQLATFLDGPLDVLAHLVAGAVGVAQLVGLVDHDKIKRDGPDFCPHCTGKFSDVTTTRSVINGFGLPLAWACL